MMTFYRVYEDEIVGADNPEELVSYLARTSMMPVDERGFRERAAYWLDGLWGEKVRTGTDAEFVADMLAIGRYQVVEKH